MQNLRTLVLILLMAQVCQPAFGQGNFFGGLQLNSDFFIRDERVGAANTPHYDNLKTGSDGWFNLNYVNNDFGLDVGLRLDLFLNSNLHNPGTPYSAQGIGMFYMRKRFKSLTITGGHFYDQIGSGIIFRSYEDRSLGIDNALLGIHLEYNILEKVKVKAFGGVEKNRLQLYKPIIKGAAVEGFFNIGEKLQIFPGVGVVNRTLDQASMDFIVSSIESYDTTMRFVPKYNTYAFSAYNTINIGNFSWYIEAAYKTKEAIPNNDAILINKAGNVLYSSLTFGIKGFGISGQVKRTQNFVLRTSPNEILLNGMISYIPSVTKQNSLRLPARYNAASQQLEEMAYSLDITYSPSREITFNLNGSEVRDFDNALLWRELYLDMEWRINKSWRIEGGMQHVEYDQIFYQGENYTGDERPVMTYTPFVEVIWKVNRKHALRLELQHMSTDEDFGAWAYGLLEYTIAPWFSISVSDMYNYNPNEGRTDLANHYYSVFTSFTHDTHRLTLAYVRQVEGVVCTGGVCRFEPAFSGVRLSFNTTF